MKQTKRAKALLASGLTLLLLLSLFPLQILAEDSGGTEPTIVITDPVETPTDPPAEEKQEPSADKKPETSAEPSVEKKPETPTEPSADKKPETPAEPSADKKAETPADSSAEKKPETPVEPPADKKTETPADSSADKKAETPAVEPNADTSDDTTTQTVTISGTVVWFRVPDGAQAPKLTLSLVRNSEKTVATLPSVTATGGKANYSFPAQPKTDEQGQSYQYKVHAKLSQPDPNYTVKVNASTRKITVAYAAAPNGVATLSLNAEESLTPASNDLSGSFAPTVSLSWSGIPEDAEPSVTITLFQNGTEFSTATAYAGDSSCLFPNCPENDENGQPYSYTLTAAVSPLSGYTLAASVSGMSVSVTCQPQTVPEKVPSGEPAEEEPAAPTVSDEEIQSIISAIDALPSKNAIGEMIAYDDEYYVAYDAFLSVYTVVDELSPEDQALITNLDAFYALLEDCGDYLNAPVMYTMVEPASVYFSINWQGSTANIPASITLPLLRDGVECQSITLSKSSYAANATVWKGEVNGLPKSKVNGTLLKYTIQWPTVPNYSCTGGDLTATYIPSPTSYKISVCWLNETAGDFALPASVDVTLANITPAAGSAATVTVRGDLGWKQTLQGTPTSDSEPVKISSVTDIPGFTPQFSVAADGTLIVTYVYTKDYINIHGYIYWPSTYPIRPDCVTVRLVRTDGYGNFEDVTSMSVSAWGENEFAFSNYPCCDKDGAPYYYAVIQNELDDYVTTYERSGGNYNIINHIADKNLYTFHVQIDWKDSSNRRGKRPLYVKLNLYRNDVLWRVLEFNSADQWNNYFLNLPKANGVPYKYTLKGEKVKGYGSSTVKLNADALNYFTYRYGSSSSGTGSSSGTSSLYTVSSAPAPDLRDSLEASAALLTQSQREALIAESAAANSVLQQVQQTAVSGDSVINFTVLSQQNSDTAAWLMQDGGTINYPVVRGTDNTYYTSHLFNQEANRAGSLFIDSSCGKDFSARNTVIYGKNMSDGSMFAALPLYKDQSYYDAHPTMTLYTPGGNYTLELFAAFYTGNTTADVAQTVFSGSADFTAYMDSCRLKSLFSSSVSVSYNDHIVTLVTGDNADSNRRFVVMGRMVALQQQNVVGKAK